MHSADYVVARCPSVRPSVWPSHAGILSKLLTYPQTVFTFGYPHHSSFSILNGMAIFRRRPALTRVSNASSTKQEAQLSQRDRATLRVIEYFAKSLTQGHSKGVCKSLLVFRWNCLHLLYIYTVPEIFSVKEWRGETGSRESFKVNENGAIWLTIRLSIGPPL